MAITSYEQDGATFWRVYMNVRSTEDPMIRIQRKVSGLKSVEAALTEEKKLLAELSKQITRLEAKGSRWEQVIDKWEQDKLTYRVDDYVETTVRDYASMLRNWTKVWFGRSASDLNRGDGREVLRLAKEMGKSLPFLRRLKNTINLVYTWAIEERMVTGVHHSPVYGVDLGKEKEEKLPEILSRQEVQALIMKSDQADHSWAPMWKGALLTGMRSGELHALPWSNIEMVPTTEAELQDSLPPVQRRYGLIRVHRTWNTRTKSFGPTKGGYWRTVPVSKELYWFLSGLRQQTGQSEFVFPRSWDWTKGMQAAVLRKFCEDTGLKSIKFHTLRACFATLLISSGVAPTRVMKVCGWKDLKTMQRYIRMAGIDEQGATEGLNLLAGTSPFPRPDKARHSGAKGSYDSATEQPEDHQVMNHMADLLEFKARR